MKIQVISTALASFALANIITLPAHALSIYQLQGNQFAIICNDGTGYSFSGSANGAQEAGALLCAEHGGIVDVQTTLSAHQALKDRDRAGADKPGKDRALDKATPKLMEATKSPQPADGAYIKIDDVKGESTD